MNACVFEGECAEMQEISFCYSELKFMDTWLCFQLVFLLLLKKHSGECDINSRQKGHKPGFQANVGGQYSLHTADRQEMGQMSMTAQKGIDTV